MSEHSIKFERSKDTGYYAATCSRCAWAAIERTFTAVQLRASAHVAGEWVELDPLTGEEKQPSEAA